MSRILAALLFAALAFGYPALAQDKGKGDKGKERAQKVLIDNDKVRVTETTFRPGEVSPSIARPYRVTYVVKGGSLERTHADGKVEKVEFKTGQSFESGPDKPWSTKNTGRGDVVLFTVTPKQAKAEAAKKK
jgi:mannose-6-phosphate isomerase-like protein (cupin superfamily)